MIIIAVVLLLLLGVGGFVLLGKSRKAPAETTSTSTTQEETKTVSGTKKSLRDLLGLGSSQMCTYSAEVEGGSTTGKIYLSSGKMRGDFITSASGQTMGSHMITEGQTIYMWTDGQTMGFKMTTDVDVTSEPTGTTSQNKNLDWDAQYDYDCQAWSPDETLFTRPAGVTFSDFGASKCAACDSLPGDSKAQCLKALGCPAS